MTNEEKVRQALAGVLTNLSNYPLEVQGQLWGRSMSEVIDKAVEAVMAAEVVEKPYEPLARAQVTRVELIVDSQRDRVIYGAENVSTALQDDGRTLKVFLDTEEYTLIKKRIDDGT